MSIKSEKNFQLDFSLSIVIGLHNKEKDIEKTIRSIFNNIEANNLQLIVVENGSTDNSYLIAKKLKQELSKPNFDFILLESNKGLGVALKKGIDYATNDYIYILPADLAFGFSELEFIAKNKIIEFDFLLGSKSHKESVVYRQFSRKVYSLCFNILQRLILNFDFSDTQGTMILKSNLLKNKKLYCQEFLITTEIVLIAHTSKAKIQEVPLFEQEQKSGSTVKPFRDGTKMLIDLFMLRKKYVQ
tara:strand:+ start:866 stop:1597 length:732 start_codon:yes stop_codon:yes gene_type:complete